jgi:zinc finger BED domain-containing protein 1 (E3 SUMO-protein ligase ZBED1)
MILNHIDGINHVTITCYAWTSPTNCAYLGVTCHFVDENFKLQSKVLSLRNVVEAKTGGFLFDKLKEILNEWRLNAKVFIIIFYLCSLFFICTIL